MGLLDAGLLSIALLGSCMAIRGRFRLLGAAAFAKLFVVAVFAFLSDVPAVKILTLPAGELGKPRIGLQNLDIER